MDRDQLSAAGICAQEGCARFNGNEALYERYLNRFLSDTGFADLSAALEGRDVSAAFAAAHALKGVAGNLSMTRLYADLCPLVEELRGGGLARAQKLLEQVARDYGEVVDVLKKK